MLKLRIDWVKRRVYISDIEKVWRKSEIKDLKDVTAEFNDNVIWLHKHKDTIQTSNGDMYRIKIDKIKEAIRYTLD